MAGVSKPTTLVVGLCYSIIPNFLNCLIILFTCLHLVSFFCQYPAHLNQEPNSPEIKSADLFFTGAVPGNELFISYNKPNIIISLAFI
jgi:hypothetical protein